MYTLEQLQEVFKMDRFATTLGMAIDSIAEERAVCSVAINEQHHNAVGTAQGGIIFTLADFAFAVAANCKGGGIIVTLGSTIHFLRPATGNRLIATAYPVSRTKRTCLFEVSIEDETGKPIARVSMTGFTREPKEGEKLPPYQAG